MSPERLVDIFVGRLRTLARLLDMAEAQWRADDRDTDALAAARLADDMFPLGYQVALACHQAKNFAIFALEGPLARAEFIPATSTFSFVDLGPLIDVTIAHVDRARVVDPAALSMDKRVDIPGGLHLEMPGEAYIDDWLLPHFYFHLVTAYDILRHAGVKIGKADYMAHLGPYLRGMPAPNP